MKNFYSILFISAFFLTKAQTSVFSVKDIDNGLATVVHNQQFIKTTTPNGLEHSFHFKITNTSAVSKTLTVIKFENTLNAGAASYFCFDGACFLPGTNAASIAVPAGTSFSLIPKFDEGPTIGMSNLSYEIADQANGSDNLTVVLKYNPPASVKELSNLLSSGAGIYPNPSNSKSYFDLYAAQDLNATSLKVYNSIGSVVSSKSINLTKGKNILPIDSENLEAGIYFVSVSVGNSKIVKKLTITN